MHQFKAAIKEAIWPFLFSRCIIIVISYITAILIPQIGSGLLQCTQGIHPNPCLLLWYRWDTGWYMGIGHLGYASKEGVAFFPLWPLLIHAGGELLGGTYPFSYYLAGLLLANLCFFFALVLFYCLLA